MRSAELQQWLDSYQTKRHQAICDIDELSPALKTELLREALSYDDIHENYDLNKKQDVEKPRRDFLALDAYFKMDECWGPVVMELAAWTPERNTPFARLFSLSALFGVLDKKERRKYYSQDFLYAQAGTTVKYTGEKLSQTDWDVWHVVLNLMKGHFNDVQFIPAVEILRGLRWVRTGPNIELLKKVLMRLRAALIIVENKTKNNEFNIGRFATLNLIKDLDCNDPNGNLIRIGLDSRLCRLFDNNQYALVDWDVRARLRKNELAKKLQTVFGYQKANCQVNRLETIQQLSGLTSEPKEFTRLLTKALNLMVREKAIHSFWLSKPPRGKLSDRTVYIWKKDAPVAGEIPIKAGQYVDESVLKANGDKPKQKRTLVPKQGDLDF